jgi:tRNA(Ile2) C34 agmatinyltransferase TiaS
VAHDNSAKCPRCGKRTNTTRAGNSHTYYCHHCQMAFEDIDDGDTGRGRPEIIASKHEEYQARQATRQTAHSTARR